MKGGFVMEDQLIIELFFERSEDAIRELSLKYEKMCRRLANKFLHNEQDIEEGRSVPQPDRDSCSSFCLQ